MVREKECNEAMRAASHTCSACISTEFIGLLPARTATIAIAVRIIRYLCRDHGQPAPSSLNVTIPEIESRLAILPRLEVFDEPVTQDSEFNRNWI